MHGCLVDNLDSSGLCCSVILIIMKAMYTVTAVVGIKDREGGALWKTLHSMFIGTTPGHGWRTPKANNSTRIGWPMLTGQSRTLFVAGRPARWWPWRPWGTGTRWSMRSRPEAASRNWLTRDWQNG